MGESNSGISAEKKKGGGEEEEDSNIIIIKSGGGGGGGPNTTPTIKYLRTKLAKPNQFDSSSSSPSPLLLHNNNTYYLNLKKQLKDVEISIPIVYGSAAFWLGKKASEFQSHKWTVYVRGATNEDLSAVVKKAVFQLHASFNTPMRVLESPPFEVSESGWGEFEIAITLHFHSDVSDKPLHLFHHLKLYPEEESGPMTMKKPVVVESYDEIVFTEPSEGFFSRVQNHPALTVPRLPPGFSLPPVEDSEKRKRGDMKDNPLNQWFTNFSEADELLKLAAARQQVQTHIARLRRQLSVIEGQQQLKNSPDM